MVGYVILGVGVILSALLFQDAIQSEYQRSRFRARMASGWYNARHQIRDRFHSEVLSQQLQRSGWKISASTYNTLRIVITVCAAVIGIMGYFEGHLIAVIYPMVIWLFTAYQKPYPMYFGFQALQQLASTERNGDLYLLYRLLLQEIVAFQDHPIAVSEMLRRQLSRTKRIRPFLERCLNDWEDDPKVALKRLGDDLSTEQAKLFSHMLMQIEEAGIDAALDIFQTNHESFREDRLTTFRNTLGIRAIFATALTLIGFGVLSYDFQVILQLYTQSMMKLTS